MYETSGLSPPATPSLALEPASQTSPASGEYSSWSLSENLRLASLGIFVSVLLLAWRQRLVCKQHHSTACDNPVASFDCPRARAASRNSHAIPLALERMRKPVIIAIASVALYILNLLNGTQQIAIQSTVTMLNDMLYGLGRSNW